MLTYVLMTSYVTLFYSPYIIRYELNFMNATMWDSYTWTYSTAFTMAADRLDHIRAAGGSHLLIFDGVKMGANVMLNGKVIGRSKQTTPLSNQESARGH